MTSSAPDNDRIHALLAVAAETDPEAAAWLRDSLRREAAAREARKRGGERAGAINAARAIQKWRGAAEVLARQIRAARPSTSTLVLAQAIADQVDFKAPPIATIEAYIRALERQLSDALPRSTGHPEVLSARRKLVAIGLAPEG
jgi:hypothetical protein